MQSFTKTLIVLTMALSARAVNTQAAEQAESPATNNWFNSWTNNTSLKTDVKREVSPGMRPVTRAYISAGSRRFGVEVPEGYQVQSSMPDQVTMTTKDLTSSLGFRIAGKATEDAWALKPEFFRDLVLEQFAGAKILEEFVMPAAVGKMGLAFDLQMSGPSGTMRRARVTFVPTDAGILQFNTLASLEKFKPALADFHTLMLTFRASDADGKLEMPALPQKI
jgi:hypothetical protein